MKDVKILAVDTLTQACSVCLRVGDSSFSEFEITPQTHANHVLAMVQKVLSDAKIEGKEIDCLALSEGPGAFTGVRIAAGVVQGLAFGWQKPVISISTLEALAWPMLNQSKAKSVAACLDARMKEVYVQICRLEEGSLVSEPAQLLSEADVITLCREKSVDCGTGDIDQEYPELVEFFTNWKSGLPNAENLAVIATQRLDQAKSVLDVVPVPLYLRNNVAEKPK